MKKHFLILLLSFCLFTCYSQQNWFNIKAFLPRWNGAEISVLSNNRLLFSGKVVNDLFDYSGSTNSPTQALLKIKFRKDIFHVSFFLEQGIIKIRDAGEKNLVAYGTQANDTYVFLNKNFDSITAQQRISSFQQAINYKRKLATDYIRNHPSSIVSLQLLKDYYYLALDADETTYYSLVQMIDENLRQTYYGLEMLKESNQRFSTAPGSPAPNMQLKDTSGKAASLFKNGEYTLIDFWASWCLPCRKENKELIKIFTKHKSSGFSITSVSLDQNKLLWLSAIKQDKMLWNQLSDLKGFDSPAATKYGIKLVPMNYLINGEGFIVAKNLHAEQIDHLLDSISKK